MNFFRTYGLLPRFYLSWCTVIVLMAASFNWEWLWYPAWVLLGMVLLATIIDLLRLLRLSQPLQLQRSHSKVLSLKDANNVQIRIRNISPVYLQLELIDEVPAQFQLRDQTYYLSLQPNEYKTLQYDLHPKERGIYNFGSTIAWIRTRMAFWQKKISTAGAYNVAVYPSVIHMREMELKANLKAHELYGIKKVRSLGVSYEFEQIKPYVMGDNYRHINWKATSRHANTMVNHFQEERSKQVYCIIDQGRAMYMPFNGLSLMDYAVNTSLALSNIVLKNDDKAGLIAVGKKSGSFLPAEKKQGQLQRILENLYQLESQQVEANFEELYIRIRKRITTRSLIFLFTNFESMYAMERILPALRKLNKFHLLVVVFFENPLLEEMNLQTAHSMSDLYQVSIAKKISLDKKLLLQQLKQYGINAVLTPPEALSIQAINTYLRIKASGII